jgi:hypothetical protein
LIDRLNRRIISLLSLVLCGPAAHAASLPQRQPGLWQSTTNVLGQDGQPLPGGSNVVTVSCVDAATDLKFFTFKGSNCSSFSINGGGGTYTIDSVCSHHGKPAKIHETIVYLDANNITLNASYDPGTGPITISASLTFQGACLPGMQPGDEGDIENGAFVQTDNINDTENQ